MATSNSSGAGRVAPTVKTANNSQVASLDDDKRQDPHMIVGFNVQAMVTTNNANGNKTNPFSLDM